MGAPLRVELGDASRWVAAPADGVQLALASDVGPGGRPALRLDFDFQGRGGWAAARLPLALELPSNWELRFAVRGEALPNHLEVKFVDPSGENVWWSVRRDFEFPLEWTPLKVKKRQVRFAWGPARGGELETVGALELVVTAGRGGRGSVWIADLELVPLPVEPAEPPSSRATSSAALAGAGPELALDGDPSTAWRAPAGGARWTVDLGTERDLGGLTLAWEEGRQPRRFTVEASEDGEAFRVLREVSRAGGGRNDLFLPETEARWLSLAVGPDAGEVGLAELTVHPPEFGESKNRFFLALARAAPRGTYPRGFSGEQVYWTVAGADGAPAEALLSEDGAVELGEGAPSLEPFVHSDGRLWSWAEAEARQSLADGDLPIPTVAWELPGLRLAATALVPEPALRPAPPGSLLAVRYRLENTGSLPRSGTLFVAARPFQVNPPTQFLNVAGGVARLARARCEGAALTLDERRVHAHPAPGECGASAFDEGPVTDWLRRGRVPDAAEVEDDFGHASAALGWPFRLAPGEASEIVLAAALAPGPKEGEPPGASADRAAQALASSGAQARWAALERATRESWHEELSRVAVRVPAAASPLVHTLRTGLAAILIHRDGPAIQPGSRSYARSWIRDGALTSTALLRLGHPGPVREFARWYATHLYPDGKVPCCVDRRGADPVDEHDSHGQWIHLVRELFRYTSDLELVESLFPSVERTVAHLDRLRASRRGEAFRTGEKQLFFGLLPESISHEGYSEKPMHSYWDDAFAYRGYADAVALAEALGRPDLARAWAASRDELAGDLLASLARAAEHHRIDHLPGCAELGDFDPTSSTVLLEPGGLSAMLPEAAVAATFDRYFREAEERRRGERAWEAYTPYELRTVGTFVRLGQRDRAHALLDFFLGDRRPAGWNAWAEVVQREPREPRFIGDLPHGWVASDFARSFLDLFAYERREDGALVLAAGVPRAWLASGEEVGVRRLRTPWGELSYALRLDRGRLTARIDGLAARPPGGVYLDLPLGPEARASVDGVVLPADPGGIALARLPARVEVNSPW